MARAEVDGKARKRISLLRIKWKLGKAYSSFTTLPGAAFIVVLSTRKASPAQTIPGLQQA